MTGVPQLMAVIALLLPAFHPDSLSSSRVVVTGDGGADVTVRCQVRSLLEVIDGLDADGDGAVSAAEIDERAGAITAYVAARYALRADTDRDLAGGRALAARGISVRHVRASDAEGPMLPEGAVDVTLRYDDAAGQAIHDLVVEVSLFRATSPDHVDLATVDWGDGGIDTFGLDAAGPAARSDPTGRGAFAAFAVMGFRHILAGWDHLLFLGALILAARRLRALLGVVTAFTVAHSITLALAALGVVNLAAYARVVELAIALSIVFVAFDSLLASSLRRTRWIEALAFGLLHGLGFAAFLGQSLVHEPARLVPLAAFNLGVEAGQVLVAVVVVTILRMLPRGRRDPGSEPDDGIAPPWVRVPGTLAIGMVGLWWVIQRI